MALSKQEFSAYIKQFQFRELFNAMGWNNDRTKLQITPDENIYTLQAVAEKSGFKILVCPPDPDGLIPDYNTRKKIETKVTKLFQEHLIIFTDHIQQEQIWQLAIRQTGKPLKVTETRYNLTQDPELLYQRASGLFFELDEEENITIVDVTQRVAANFHQNAEKVTRQFYDKFKKEHTSFLGFIKGIETKVDRDWYASLMLNRLMFCYFIQKKGFLDENKNYLRDKLKVCQEKKGKNKFYSFYRDFLLVLFHEGLNELQQKEEVKVEIGKIPYLNGGLFDEHELEKMYKDINIDDKAFERVFDFFDQYEWHLDTKVTATGKDINPDVIGYIFEKYINDRAQMGAYYTKEDITEYISKNTVLPWLFDETKRNYTRAFDPEGEIWQWVKNSGDDYIYDAVKYGVPKEGGLFDDLPDEIKAGFRPNLEQKIVKADDTPHLWEIRKPWNQKAPVEIALPTEIYREVIERRKRYADVKDKIENGKITQINQFITYNLDIRQFAQDVIENTTDPDFLRHFYKSINKVTILDPTCGSGAFLFAAMNILEPLYEACLMRMRAFVEEEDRLNEEEKRTFKNQYKFFRQVLSETQSEYHPNLQYFIYKSIILQNLYGVDIMKEAVEIAKLRLFLKLVATVDADYRKPNLGLEPLPDIDFNIRAGNTLVGFATEKEIDDAFAGTLDFDHDAEKIKEKCDIVARTFTRYKEIQLSTGDGYHDFKAAKEELNRRLKELNYELNLLLHKQASGLKYEDWLASHQPFHWFAEYYEIIHGQGGFDVVIGNPPYLEARQINYDVKNLITKESNTVHAMCIERSYNVLSNNGSICMIVPLSIVCTQRMIETQKIIENHGITWYSNYSWRPGKLFDQVNRALTIFCTNKSDRRSKYSTRYMKWNAEHRELLIPTLSYVQYNSDRNSFWFPKLSSLIELDILNKVLSKKYSSTLTH
ncbi:MAG: Eco57I restriction-modification methylase domain-containing protein [Bacteroidales bacterium]|nr:Eco57I restriction-modification methylase domain-containing protein [Bacteroidales bacterium]